MTKPRRKSQAARRIRKVDWDVLIKQYRTVIAREMERLLDLSHGSKLEKDDTTALSSYIKIINELKKQDLADLDKLTDEQLEALSKGESK